MKKFVYCALILLLSNVVYAQNHKWVYKNGYDSNPYNMEVTPDNLAAIDAMSLDKIKVQGGLLLTVKELNAMIDAFNKAKVVYSAIEKKRNNLSINDLEKVIANLNFNTDTRFFYGSNWCYCYDNQICFSYLFIHEKPYLAIKTPHLVSATNQFVKTDGFVIMFNSISEMDAFSIMLNSMVTQLQTNNQLTKN